MSITQAFIKRHALVIYYVMTFIISFSGFILVVGPGSFPGTSEQVNTLLPPAVMAMLIGPSFSGLLLTGLIDGRVGLRRIFSSLGNWRAGAGWYALALLLAPVLAMAVNLVLSQDSAVFTADNPALVVLVGVAAGFSTILEEIGWTGFVVPRLRLRYTVLTTGLIVGVPWAAWHLMQILFMCGTFAADVPLPLFVTLYILASVAGLTAYRILLVWVYDQTASLLVTTLMHASYTACTTMIFATSATGAAFLASLWVMAAMIWAVVAIVGVYNRWKITAQVARGQAA